MPPTKKPNPTQQTPTPTQQTPTPTATPDPNTLSILNQLYDDIVALEQNFGKLLKKDPELKDHEQDEEKLETLLNSLS